jgi:phage terminase large subunit-like protein
MYGVGISKTGELVDLGVKAGIVEKSGSWYSFDGSRIGQGREAAKTFLTANADIADKIADIAKQFDLKELAYDDAWSSELIRMLGESGFPMSKMVSFPQTHMKMNSPCQELMRKVLRKEFAHADNPVMRWQMSSLRWNTQVGSGFIKPARDRKREKIDGPASLIMALARAIDPENVIKPKRAFWVVSA